MKCFGFDIEGLKDETRNCMLEFSNEPVEDCCDEYECGYGCGDD